MSDEAADRKTIWERGLKLLVWAFCAWAAWTVLSPIEAAPAWAKAVGGFVILSVGYLAWTTSKALEKQQKQLDRLEAMLSRLPGTTSSF